MAEPGFVQKAKEAKAILKHQTIDDALAYEAYMKKAKDKEVNALRAEFSRQGIIGSEYRQTYVSVRILEKVVDTYDIGSKIS